MNWVDYFFKDGLMIGLNVDILKIYVKYCINLVMNCFGLKVLFLEVIIDLLVWMNKWLLIDIL